MLMLLTSMMGAAMVPRPTFPTGMSVHSISSQLPRWLPDVGRPSVSFSTAQAAPVAVDTRTKRPSEEHPGWAVAVVISLVFRAIGHAGALMLVALPAAMVASPGSHVLQTVATAPLATQFVAAWLLSEGCFYASCVARARLMSADESCLERPLLPARRRKLWRQILRDPTCSTQSFVQGWFYADAGPGRVRQGGARSALVGLARDLAGLGVEPPARHVRYGELCRGDVMYWLSSGLFEKALCTLSPSEHSELENLVDELEVSAGVKLPVRPGRGDNSDGRSGSLTDGTTDGVRSMCLALDDVRWLHRPLLYYGLTHGIYSSVFTPRSFARMGFDQRCEAGLHYYVHTAIHTASGRSAGGREAVARASRAAPVKAAPVDGAIGRASMGAVSERTAIVFIHGVGVGPGPYIESLLEQLIGGPATAPRKGQIRKVDGGVEAVGNAGVAPPPPRDAGVTLTGVGGGHSNSYGNDRREATAAAAATSASSAMSDAVSMVMDACRRGPQGAEGADGTGGTEGAERSTVEERTCRLGKGVRGSSVAPFKLALPNLEPFGVARDGVSACDDAEEDVGYTADASDAAGAADDGARHTTERVEQIVIALDMRHFSQRVEMSTPATPEQFASQYCAILDAHGLESAVVVGHSLGTAYVNYLRRHAPQRVGAVALIDPICCMLHQAAITRAFVYKPVGSSARVAAEEYYVRRELFTSNVISRHMRWHEAALWPSECNPATPTLIVLSGEDSIVPVQAIHSCASTWQAKARGVEVLLLPGLGHGGWLGDKAAAAQIASRVRALRSRSISLPDFHLPDWHHHLQGMNAQIQQVIGLPPSSLPADPFRLRSGSRPRS